MKPLEARNQFFLHNTIVFLSFCAVSAVGMILNPQSFQKFFFPATDLPTPNPSLSYYWDIQSYAELALHPKCSAFYPLWPSLIRWLFAPTTIDEAARGFLIIATVLFILSIPLALLVFRTAFQNNRLALGIALLYSLSPLAIFRVIGYTESWFAFCSLLLLFLLIKLPPNWPRALFFLSLFILASVLSLTRPILVQTLGSCGATLITFMGIEVLQFQPSNSQSWFQTMKTSWTRVSQRYPLAIPISICLTLGALCGYGLYGLFCWQLTENFWEPFALQKLWGKSLGLRPWLLLTSRSQLVDLLGMYLSIFLWCFALGQVMVIFRNWSLPRLWGGKLGLVLAFYPPLWILVQAWGNRSEQARSILRTENSHYNLASRNTLPPWVNCYGFWFALYFALIHSGIVFLTQGRLVSLGRYIFAQPFIFLVLGYLYPHLERSQKRFVLPSLIGISALYLINQWIRYGYHKWIG